MKLPTKLFGNSGAHENGRWHFEQKHKDIALVVIVSILTVAIFVLCLKISEKITGREFTPAWDHTERVQVVEAESTTEPAEIQTTANEPTNEVTTSDSNDKELLAIGIYVVTAGCSTSDYSLVMVGNVIENRVESNRYPDTLEGVLTQPAQFGALEQTGVKWPTGAGTAAKDRALAAAEKVLNGERVLPWDVVYVSNTRQGETVAMLDGLYFCR